MSSSVAARAADRAVSGRRAPGIATTAGREPEQPGEGDLGGSRPMRLRDIGEPLATSKPTRPSRSAQRRVRNHRDVALDTALDDASAKRTVVVRAERDLNRRDRDELERLVELIAVDVRHADAPDEAFVDESGQRTQGGPPRRPRIRRVDEVEVDLAGRPAPRGSPRSRRGSPSRDRPEPTAPSGRAIPPFVTIRARVAPRRRARASSLSLWPSSRLVVAVRLRGVEDRHARLDGGRDRLDRELRVAALVRRHPHATEADAEL